LRPRLLRAQTAALACRYDLGMEPDRRQDRATAATITEALRMKSAFGLIAAQVFAARRDIPLQVADRALAGRHDPRQQPS
jgi:hypothetical protein